MSLIHSPIHNKEISTLGIEVGEYADSSTLEVVNATIYFSCAVTLMFGRRDLMPMVWAWSVASARANYETDTEHGTDRSVGLLLKHFVDIGIGNGINWRVTAKESSEPSNLCFLCNLAMGVLDTHLIPDGDLKLSIAMQKAGASPDDMELFSIVSRMAFIGRVIANTGYDIFQHQETGNDGYDENIAYGYNELSRVRGLSLDHLPLLAAKAYSKLKGKKNMYSVWTTMSQEVCCNSKISKIEDYSDKPTFAEETMQRRWLGGSISQYLKSCRDHSNEVSVETVAAYVIKNMMADGHTIDSAKSSVVSVLDAIKLLNSSFKCYKPITFMSEESYQSFMRDGVTKTIWDLEKEVFMSNTWHWKYSDCPTNARLVTEKRLWGEKAYNTVYAALASFEMKDVIYSLSYMYGKVAVEWKRDVLNYSTITAGDSMSCAYSVPSTNSNIVKYLLPILLARMSGSWSNVEGLASYVTSSIFGGRKMMNYVETQIHSRLTPNDIQSVRIIQ